MFGCHLRTVIFMLLVKKVAQFEMRLPRGLIWCLKNPISCVTLHVKAYGAKLA